MSPAVLNRIREIQKNDISSNEDITSKRDKIYSAEELNSSLGINRDYKSNPGFMANDTVLRVAAIKILSEDKQLSTKDHDVAREIRALGKLGLQRDHEALLLKVVESILNFDEIRALTADFEKLDQRAYDAARLFYSNARSRMDTVTINDKFKA